MRVLVLHSQYRSGATSGENRVVEDEARLLRSAGYSVGVLEPSVGGRVATIRAGVGAVWDPSRAAQVRRAIRGFHPDVVHAHNLFPALSPAVIRAAAAERVPVVMTLHNFRLLCLPATFLRDGQVCEDCLGRLPWPGVMHGCYRGSRLASVPYFASLSLHRSIGTFESVARFVAVSGFVRDKHIQAGFPGDRIIVKPNFAWPAPRREGPGDYFLFLGRLSSEKGLALLLRSWLRSFGRLVVAGDGPERSLVGSAPPEAEFRGSVSSQGVQGLLQHARALILPSRSYEAFPRAVVEAYAQGIPVIASRLGALTEVVDDGVTGLLAEPNDTASLVTAIERLLDDEESQRLGARAYREWSDHYTPEDNLSHLGAIYEKAIAVAG